MERKADNERDYFLATCKVPKRDKAGNDTTFHKLSTGGFRREDGTLSAMAYDIKPIDDSDDSALGAPKAMLNELALEEQRMIATQAEDSHTKLEAVFYVGNCLNEVVTFLNAHPEVIKKAVDWYHNVEGKIKAIRTKPKLEPKQAKKSAKPQSEFVKTEQEPQSTMTVEQARNEVLNSLGHYIEMKNGFQRLSNANVIDPQKIGFDAVIAQLEGIVQRFPALMDATTEASILSINLDELESRRVKEVLLVQSND